MIDPQLVHALQPEEVVGQLPVDQGHEPLPGFKHDGTPWTDAEVEAVWAGLRDEASRLTEIGASVGSAPESSDP